MTGVRARPRLRWIATRRIAALAPVVIAAAAAVAADERVTCAVPSPAHPTCQAAVDDAACDVIHVAAGTHTEGLIVVPRSLELTGADVQLTTVEGRIEIVGVGTVVQLGGLRLARASPCGAPPDGAVHVGPGARVEAFGVQSHTTGDPPNPLFCDGFESGGLAAWSTAVP